MPNVELTEEDIALLEAARAKTSPKSEAAPGRPIPPRAKKPQDRKTSTPKLGHQQAPTGKYTLGKKSAAEERDLELPSGAWCRVKVVGPETLMSSGLLDHIDSLTAIVSGEMIPQAQKGKTNTPDTAAIAKDMKAIKAIMDKYDELTLAVVVEPQLHKAPETEAERDEDLAYIDQVSFEDKAYIMQYVMGGTADLETFRQESQESVASLAAITSSASSGE